MLRGASRGASRGLPQGGKREDALPLPHEARGFSRGSLIASRGGLHDRMWPSVLEDVDETFPLPPEARAMSRSAMIASRGSVIASRGASRPDDSAALPSVATGPRPGSVQAANLFNDRWPSPASPTRPSKVELDRLTALEVSVAQLKNIGRKRERRIAELESKLIEAVSKGPQAKSVASSGELFQAWS